MIQYQSQKELNLNIKTMNKNKFNQEDWQGKSKRQVENSAKGCFIAGLGGLLLIVWLVIVNNF